MAVTQQAEIQTPTHWPGLAALSAADRRCLMPLLARDPWACELAKDNALLFFLLVRAQQRYKLTMRQVQLMTRMKRPALLSLLRYEGSPAMERFLRRCGFLRLDNPEFEVLHRFVQRPVPSWAMHWQVPHLALFTSVDEMTLPYASISCGNVMRDRDVVHPTLVNCKPEELRGVLPGAVRALVSRYAEIARLIAIIDDAAEQRRERAALSRCPNIARLSWLHDDLGDRGQHHWSRYVQMRMAGRTWPAPPLRGSLDVQPITDARTLIEEGYRMHHCIPTYIDRILNGTGYAYRVFAPQRATLFIEKSAQGIWKVFDVRTVCNGVPNRETDSVVDHWLADALRASNA